MTHTVSKTPLGDAASVVVANVLIGNANACTLQ